MDARLREFERRLDSFGAARKNDVREVEAGLVEIADLSADSASAVDDLMAAVCELAELIGGDS